MIQAAHTPIWRYLTIPEAVVPERARSMALAAVEEHARRLGLATRPALHWIDDATNATPARLRYLRSLGWAPTYHERHAPVLGFMLDGQPSIFIYACGRLSEILTVVAHECRHVWQDQRGRPGDEADARRYEETADPPGWTRSVLVAPRYWPH